MRERQALVGSVIFFLAAPGVVASLMPWLVAGWRMEPSRLPLKLLGILLIAIGAAFLLHSFGRFVWEGRGTPAPVAPTEHLVVGGVYRYVRNPMYLAVLTIIVGQWLLIGQVSVLVYGAVIAAAVATFVKIYEEPTLAEQHGAAYEAYRRAVPGWMPRLTPWNGTKSQAE
jgi:protein-S-isoprenylcysteine O-methyltransferase Ste14